tara:strand:- start:6303 stop:8075 length:1773 start_codon:yes stop_codon:yes gene_type:complete
MKENNLKVFILLKSLFNKLKRIRKLQIIFLFFFILVAAFSELITLSLAFPFIEIISNSGDIWEIKLISKIFSFLGFSKEQNLIGPMVILFSGSAFLSGLIKNFNLWFGSRLAAKIGSDVSCECYKRNLYQDYEIFINKNSSELITNNTLYINKFTDVLQVSARFFTALIISFVISIYMISLNFVYSLLAIIIFVLAYLLIAKYSKSRLRVNSQIIANNSKSQVQLMNETNGSFRDIILGFNQKEYLDLYANLDLKKRMSEAENVFINLFPRNTIESLLLIFVAILSFFVNNDTSLTLFIPTIGTLAIGAQKLLPFMQQTYGSWSFLAGSSSSLIKIFEMLKLPINKNFINYSPKSLKFLNEIKFVDLSFRYKDSKKYIFKNFNFSIKKGDIIGIIGKTGSGKSSFADLFMGLISPTRGNIYLDGVQIFDSFNSYKKIDYRKLIAHVPQNIFLIDSTIAANISFNFNLDIIDLKKIREAAKQSNIHNFIEDLPNGYSTMVGENGVKLSGGQRQRIGIARALYQKKSILVLDEATSALDSSTEKSILDSIYKFKKDKTILIITHRIDALKKCNKILNFDDGRIELDINKVQE